MPCTRESRAGRFHRRCGRAISCFLYPWPSFLLVSFAMLPWPCFVLLYQGRGLFIPPNRRGVVFSELTAKNGNKMTVRVVKADEGPVQGKVRSSWKGRANPNSELDVRRFGAATCACQVEEM